ncbi:hypothetical protein [Pilimelia columellifera]|uniref:hypothetical protein n=1 Tax=Pilimelia columellifera TaxID=706574 RepID=UPI0031E475AC
MAIADVGLDRPWLPLAPAAGARRRESSRHALVRAIGLGREQQASALVIVGGLFDRATVTLPTLEFAARAFAAFPGPVLIAPGALDWHTETSPYATTNWFDNTHLWHDAQYRPGVTVDGDTIAGSAWTGSSLGGEPPLSSSADEERVLYVRAGLAPRARPVVCSTAADADDERVVAVGALTPAVGAGGATVTVIDWSNGSLRSTQLMIDDEPGETRPVDVATVNGTDELLARLSSTVDSVPPWSVIALHGRLPSGVLLPSIAGFTTDREDVLIDETAVEFALAPPANADHSAMTEFRRGMRDSDADERTLHQATALGLRALAEVAPDGEPI